MNTGNSINLIIFLVKFVIVVLTFLSSIFVRVGVGATFVPSGPLRRASRSIVSQLKMGSTPTTATKEYAPSQVVLDESTGEKWRLCAGVAVLNSQNQVLVAERLGRPGNWQCPQGGVDDAWTPSGAKDELPKESIVQAAIRELYEETGLQLGHHVVMDHTFPHPSVGSNSGIRYSTNTGTGDANWLTRAGFSGQELHWTVFRCTDGRGDFEPGTMCDLSGKGGESAEFSQVTWKPIDEAVRSIWEGKRAPYLALQSLINEYGSKWQAQVNQLDFSGKWGRDLSLSTGVIEGLESRGLTSEDAKEEAAKPYIQLWERSSQDPTAWFVTTYEKDGTSPRRKLEYKPGTWEESYQGKSTLFGESGAPVTLKRRTSYVAEPDASPIPMAQVTITDGPKGVEESRRYLKDGNLVLRRTLWPKDQPNTSSISTEVFTKIPADC